MIYVTFFILMTMFLIFLIYALQSEEIISIYTALTMLKIVILSVVIFVLVGCMIAIFNI